MKKFHPISEEKKIPEKPLAFRANSSIRAKVKGLAKKYGITESEAIRQAIEVAADADGGKS